MDEKSVSNIKVWIDVQIPCRLLVNGVDMDVVPGDRISVVPIRLGVPFCPMIEIRELSSKDELHG